MNQGYIYDQKYKRFRLSSGLFRYQLDYSHVNFRLTEKNKVQKNQAISRFRVTGR